LIHLNALYWQPRNRSGMPQPDEPPEAKDKKPSRLEEARRIIEDYAQDLRSRSFVAG
jgi:hypothetical protein